MKVLYPVDIREEELKLRVAKDWFASYDTTKILGSIDFCVAVPNDASLFKDETESLIWGEAKQGTSHDIYHSFVQLILTVGKARTFDRNLPPQYLAAFDCARFAFLPYHAVQDVFFQNDFNWNVTPSDHTSKEFNQLYQLVEKTLKEQSLVYNFVDDEKALRKFIKQNIVLGNSKTKRHKVTKNNFTFVYQRWCEEVKNSIQINWNDVKASGLLDADFFLADLLSKDGNYLLDTLFVLLKHNYYQFDRNIDPRGIFNVSQASFTDNMQAHIAFWNKYERPPKREYWEYIYSRRDLLVPQDVRERKGSFFTPKQWVELSQEYLAKALNEDWQDNYYIWDCCAGTGNLLNGLANPHRIWASTLDKADVDVMHERVRNGARLFDNHIFQFDFLNDDFSKLPEELRAIINDEEKRKHLIIYINPPYAEAGSTFGKEAKVGVSNTTMTHKDFASECGTYAKRELFVQFFMRIYKQIPQCVLAEFSTLKILQAPYFRDFRRIFKAKLDCSFIVPADTFDNVKGKFPIGFLVWKLAEPEHFEETYTDVYDRNGNYIEKKYLSSYEESTMLNDWLRASWKNVENPMGYLVCNGNDFQHQNEIAILSKKSNETSTFFKPITQANLMKSCIYLAVRQCIEATWLNDRDQFLYPNVEWSSDKTFQLDCMVYALFHTQNRITIKEGTNHWIPFYEHEIGITEGFASHFMQDFIRDLLSGKAQQQNEADLFSPNGQDNCAEEYSAVTMSAEARSVMEAGKAVYQYYHEVRKQKGSGSLNASLYDIKEYFKGRNDKGQIKATSEDYPHFNELMETLRIALQSLAEALRPKVYLYGFLK